MRNGGTVQWDDKRTQDLSNISVVMHKSSQQERPFQ